jgi:hypothetical protein
MLHGCSYPCFLNQPAAERLHAVWNLCIDTCLAYTTPGANPFSGFLQVARLHNLRLLQQAMDSTKSLAVHGERHEQSPGPNAVVPLLTLQLASPLLQCVK